jgi:N-formylglutamate amidohydrolase
MRVVTYTERLLVKHHLGTMPVLLTCPHDGIEAPAGVALRSRNATAGNCNFRTGPDRGTAAITEGVAQRILDLTGLSPSVTIARFERRFIDANRSFECAFTDSANAPAFYNEYQRRIAQAAGQILQQNGGRGFLFDIHGTNGVDSDPADVYLGTADGGTLLPDFNRDAIFAQHGLHGLLASVRRNFAGLGRRAPLRYRVSPASQKATETRRLNGGFTVRHYGAVINSIQIEVVSALRTDAVLREAFIDDLAFAIINFTRRHAPF